MTNHGYTPLIVVMNKAKFDSLLPALQTAIIEAAKEAGQFQRDLNVKTNKILLVNYVNKELKSLKNQYRAL